MGFKMKESMRMKKKKKKKEKKELENEKVGRNREEEQEEGESRLVSSRLECQQQQQQVLGLTFMIRFGSAMAFELLSLLLFSSLLSLLLFSSLLSLLLSLFFSLLLSLLHSKPSFREKERNEGEKDGFFRIFIRDVHFPYYDFDLAIGQLKTTLKTRSPV